MSTTTHSTRSWDADLVALRDEIYAEGGCTLREAAEMARNSIGAMADYAQQWDAYANAEMAAAYQPPTPPAAPAARTPESKARDKALYHLSQGLRIVSLGSAHLVPSGTRSGIIHRVEGDTCSCEAAANGRSCWHREAVKLQSRKVAA